MAGGSIRGGQILGKYHRTLSEEAEENIGRGRLLPTTSWEAMWKPIVEWLGVEESQIEGVLPNEKNFPPEQILTQAQLFEF